MGEAMRATAVLLGATTVALVVTSFVTSLGSQQDFELGAERVWQGAGSVEDAGLAFAQQVLDWRDAGITQRLPGADVEELPASTRITLMIAGPEDRLLQVGLEAANDQKDRWNVVQLDAGVEQPIGAANGEEPVLHWRPVESRSPDRHAFEGVRGVAYVRTTERGTVAIPLDAHAVEAAQVRLDGHVEVTSDPFCHRIQSTLLLFENEGGEIASAVGGVWAGDNPPEC